MKLSVLSTLAVAFPSKTCDAFTTSPNIPRAAALKASEHDNNDFTMSRRNAAAAMFFTAVAGAPLVSQAAETSLDFSLPSYDTKMSGFGDGTEAFVKKGNIGATGVASDALMTDPGADEKEKQLASMRKAEEARKEALAKKNAERKALEEETKRRAAEKKARDKERLANIWN